MPKFAPAARRMASTVMRYGLAVFCVVAALLVTELLQHFTNGPLWFVFLAAVMISSWVAGLGPGLLAVLLSILTVDYFFVPPLYTLSLKIEYLPHLVVFGLSALLMNWLSDRRRQAEAALRRARDELEARVQERTAELTRTNERLQAESAERTRAEAALRESEEQWRAVFEHNPTMYFMVDAAGTILSVNPFGAEQLGYTVDELVGHPVLNVFYEADREAVRRNVAICFAHRGRSMSWEFRKVRKDGSVLWVRETARAMLMKNRPVVLIVCEDITERKRAEEAARRSEKELRDVIETIPAMVWRTLPDGAVDFINQRWQEFTGSPPEDALGWNWEAVVHPDDRTRFLADWRAALKSGQSMESEVRVRRADGEYRWLFVRNVPLRDELGNIVKWYGTSINIEDRKRAEEERQAHLWFLESMDRVNRAIQGTNDLEQMMSDVLDALLTIFHCDRAWLVYPCDPEALWHGVKMQRTRPEFPGLFSVGLDVPVDPETADVLRTVRAASGPVRFGPGSPHPLPAKLAQRLGIQSRIIMALYPKGDQPYMFGLSQCSYPRVWTPQEQRLFQEIGRRLEDALTTLLVFRNLQESEARLEEAQRIAHVGHWARDLETDGFTWSDETYRIFGLPPQERTIDFAGLQELIHPEDRQIRVRAEAEALAGDARYDVEFRVVRPGGDVRIVHSQSNVMRDESGRPLRMFGTVQDITERRRAEEQLFEIKERFRLLAESSLAGIYLIQEDRLRYVNPAMAKMFGYRVEEIVDRLGPMDLVHPDDRPVVAENVRRRIEGEVEEAHYEFRGLRKDGSVCYVEVHGRRIEHGGQVGVLGTLLDITERRRAEEALREAQTELARVTRVLTLGEITASIAHEVNQPLAGVTTNANASLRWLAREPPDLAEARACLQRIIRDGSRASEVIARVRALAKKSAPAKARLDLRETIHEVLALIEPEARQHRVAVRTELAAGLPPVRGDRVQLQQVLLNLVLNGIDAMKAVTERPRVLRIRAQPHEAGHVLVAVQDAGAGIAPQDLERVFTPFYTTKPEGMGLGLVISRSISEAHGGRLWATQNEPRGAVFQFTLPADEGRVL